MQPVIEVNHLSHRYGDRPALNDISFEIRAGEVFGLLGPNGAGKTTTIRLINGLFAPSAGQLNVLGMDPVRDGEAVRRKTGVLTETPALYERLTARQNLEFFATVSGVPARESRQRAQDLLEYFELDERADDRAGTFSKGMKQRLALARALIHNPPLVFLDEPTAALDPEAALQVRDWVATISRREGNTVVLCTHILTEAERLCDRVAVMGPGRLLAVGTLEELRRRVMPGLWLQIELWQPHELTLDTLAQLPGVLALDHNSPMGEANDRQPVRKLRVQIAEEAVVPQVAAAVIDQGGQLLRLQPEQISLEEVYFRLQNAQQNKGAK